MIVSAIPEGCPRVSPYLIVEPAEAVIDFMVTVFAGSEVGRHMRPGGRVMYAEVWFISTRVEDIDEGSES